MYTFIAKRSTWQKQVMQCLFHVFAQYLRNKWKKRGVRSCCNHGNATSLRTTTISLNVVALMERRHCPLSSKWTVGATSLMHQAGHCRHAIDCLYWQPLGTPLSSVAGQVTKAGNTDVACWWVLYPGSCWQCKYFPYERRGQNLTFMGPCVIVIVF